MGYRSTENTTKRTLIAQYVQKHPGSSFSELSRMLGINTSTLKYHLDRLERENCISSKKVENRRLYYPIKDFAARGTGLTKVQKRVMLIVRDNPGSSSKDICDISGMSSTIVKKALSSLIKKGKLTKVRIGGGVVYEHISKKVLKQRMFRELLARLIHGDIDERSFRSLVDQLDRDLE